MTLKDIISEAMDTTTILQQISELQQISSAINKIPQTKINDPMINQQKENFQKFVNNQLQQKKLAVQQLQTQEQQQKALQLKQTQQTQQQKNTNTINQTV